MTVSTLLCGFYPVLHSLLYITLQIAGGIVGSLLAAGLLPGVALRMGEEGPGCFTESNLGPGLTRWQVGSALTPHMQPLTCHSHVTVVTHAYMPVQRCIMQV